LKADYVSSQGHFGQAEPPRAEYAARMPLRRSQLSDAEAELRRRCASAITPGQLLARPTADDERHYVTAAID